MQKYWLISPIFSVIGHAGHMQPASLVMHVGLLPNAQ